MASIYLCEITTILRPVKHDYALDRHGWLQGTLDVYQRGRIMESPSLGFQKMLMSFLDSFAEVFWSDFPVEPSSSSCSYETFSLMERWINTYIEEHNTARNPLVGKS
jgi:hypothetical protein